MKDQDFELLSQYLDGELDQLASVRLEKRLHAEPELAAMLGELREQDARLRGALQGATRVPRHISALLESGSNVVALPRREPRPAWHYAVAASLVAAIGLVLVPNRQGTPGAEQMLATILESTPSSSDRWQELADGSRARPVLSFRDVDGQWCREYLLSTGKEQGRRGVACRQQGAWQTLVIAEAQIPGGNDAYRPANSGDSDSVAGFLAERAAGVALSAAEEAQLIADHWK